MSLLALDVSAQQRVILNPNFIQRFDRATHQPIADYDTSVRPGICTESGGKNNCLRYLGDARCLPPTAPRPPADGGGCVVGWRTTDSWDGYFPPADSGDPDRALLGRTLAGPDRGVAGETFDGSMNFQNGAAELTAVNSARLYQVLCLAAGEKIQIRFSLYDPLGTGPEPSRMKFESFRIRSSTPVQKPSPRRPRLPKRTAMRQRRSGRPRKARSRSRPAANTRSDSKRCRACSITAASSRISRCT